MAQGTKKNCMIKMKMTQNIATLDNISNFILSAMYSCVLSFFLQRWQRPEIFPTQKRSSNRSERKKKQRGKRNCFAPLFFNIMCDFRCFAFTIRVSRGKESQRRKKKKSEIDKSPNSKCRIKMHEHIVVYLIFSGSATKKNREEKKN